MSNIFIKISLFILLFFSVIYTYGVPATPLPVTRVQPDGTELTVYLKGDEFFKYELTLDGYLVKKDATGFYCYSKQDSEGKIISTGIKANQIEKRASKEKQLVNTLIKHPDLSQRNKVSRMAKVSENSDEQAIQKNFPTTGSPKSLVILVNFKDVSFVIPNPKTAFTNLLNEAGYTANGGTGSARDYFNVASNGMSTPEFVVVGPYTLANNRSYYGANDATTDDDVKPRDMVIHACNAAATNGVDFSQYDTDGDGIVDNVFIYYAGHNEAEGGPVESIWPHRWALSNTLIINGKRISGYACTSELRGSKESYMCGIGTFAHEFGHVYGLADYYNTENSEAYTVSNWNIMDAGAYLNSGRTPPTYSAFDRFYLGWITPVILNSPKNLVTLSDIKTSNKAYIITQSGTHNLNGSNPSPLEFFTLENRQKTGWDTYLPRSGMLITRIYYNQSDWMNNIPNNNASAMGYDIIEADGVANKNTLSGDPFPGSRNITNYYPVLRSGIEIPRTITSIKEINSVISFRFMLPPVIQSNQNELKTYNTILGEPLQIQKISISGSKLTSNVKINFETNSYFELKKEDDPSNNWTKVLELIPTDSVLSNISVLVRYNPTEASFSDAHVDYINVSSEDARSIRTMISGFATRPVYVVSPVATEPTSVSLKGFTANWTEVFDASGYYLTVYNVTEGTSILKEGFNNGLIPPIGWTINATTVVTQTNYSGDSVPSIQLSDTGDSIQTEIFYFPVTEFSFFIRSMGEISGKVKVEAWDGTTWSLLDNFDVSSTLNTTKSYSLQESDNYAQFRITFKKGIASVAIDDVAVKLAQKIEFNVRNLWIEDNSAFIELILPKRNYYYTVRASDKTYYIDNTTIKYENITEPSNVMPVILDDENIVRFTTKSKSVSIYKDLNGMVVLDKGSIDEANDHLIYIYSSTGKLVKVIESYDKLVPLSPIVMGQLYVVKIGETTIKFR